MSPSISGRPHKIAPLPALIVVDACVLLNLHATGRAGEILSSLSSTVLVSSFVAAEALWIASQTVDAGVGANRQPVLLEPLVHSGIIEVVDLSVEEQEIFLRYAHQLGDGEAASGAIAIARSGAVATDDRKARAVLAQHNPAIHLVGTVALLQAWEASIGLSKKEVGEALRAIRAQARYEPGTSDYGAEWWRERVATAESADQ